MLPKNRRIPRKDFHLLSSGAKIYSNELFLVRFVEVKAGFGRFCFSVSKKVAKNAVDRNKMRRAGYRYLRGVLNDLAPGVLALFSFRRKPLDDQEITKKLKEILKKSNLIK